MNEITKRNPFPHPQSTQEQSKLVGAYLPLPLANRLRLLSVYYDKSLQNILQQLIDEWSNSVNMSDKEILKALIERAVIEWQRRVMESGQISRQEQEQYLQETKSALKRRKIANHHINIIMDALKNKVGSIG